MQTMANRDVVVAFLFAKRLLIRQGVCVLFAGILVLTHSFSHWHLDIFAPKAISKICQPYLLHFTDIAHAHICKLYMRDINL